jgi:hypothetical protein
VSRKRRVSSWEFSVKLPSGVTITVILKTDNPFLLTAKDRAFVFGLVDRLKGVAEEFGTEFTMSPPLQMHRSVRSSAVG